jgi:hypothetical protein
MKNVLTPSSFVNADLATLFQRAVGIFESGRERVWRTINHEMVLGCCATYHHKFLRSSVIATIAHASTSHQIR